MNPFATEVRKLWVHKGRPSLRAVALRCGNQISHTAVSSILNGTSHPRWLTATVVIEALNGDPAEFRGLWEAVNEEVELVRRERYEATIARRHLWESATRLVLRRGDTLVVTVPDTNQPPHVIEDLWTALAEQFPRNTVRLIVGADVSVEREVAA